jgi:hypothetical protein
MQLSTSSEFLLPFSEAFCPTFHEMVLQGVSQFFSEIYLSKIPLNFHNPWEPRIFILEKDGQFHIHV